MARRIAALEARKEIAEQPLVLASGVSIEIGGAVGGAAVSPADHDEADDDDEFVEEPGTAFEEAEGLAQAIREKMPR